MTKSLGKSVINLYSNIACSVLGVGNQQDLSDDLECDPFLTAKMDGACPPTLEVLVSNLEFSQTRYGWEF